MIAYDRIPIRTWKENGPEDPSPSSSSLGKITRYLGWKSIAVGECVRGLPALTTGLLHTGPRDVNEGKHGVGAQRYRDIWLII